MDPSSFTTTYIIIAELLLSATILQLFRLTGASLKLILPMGVAMAVWIAALGIGIPSGWFLPDSISPTGMYLVIMIGALGMAAGILAIPRVRQHLLRMPPELLLFPQGIRVFLGAGFLVETALGQLSSPFGILDGLTHITAGFLALSAALGLALWHRSHWRGVWIANAFGMLDIIAVATGIAYVMLNELTTRHNMFMVVFFVAPILIAFHLASMWQAFTWRGRRNAGTLFNVFPIREPQSTTVQVS